MSAICHWVLGFAGAQTGSGSGFGLRFGATGWLFWLPAVLLLAAVFVTKCYEREPISQRRRRVLSLLKLAAMGCLAVLIAKPVAGFRTTHIDPSRTALLMDISASMAERDGGDHSRLDRFVSGWRTLVTAGALKLSPEREWEIDSFADELHAGIVSGDPAPASALTSLKPVGRRTDLGGALHSLISAPEAQRLTTVVIATDGRSTVPADWQAIISACKRNGTTVHVVRMGPDQPVPSLTVGPVWTAPKVFTFDPVEVRTSIVAGHLPARQPVVLEVYETERGAVLASKTVSPGAATSRPGEASDEIVSADVQLTVPALPPGVHRFQVRARAGAIQARPEPFEVEATEHRLRVLYVEGYPRFEYRYLKNLLAREKSVQSSCLLVSADPDFVQEGTTPIAGFPSTTDELYGFDVVILGDVDPGGSWWTVPQQELLESFVERRGGGLVVLAGRRSMPSGVLPGTALERLLPVELSSDAALPRSEPFAPVLTAAGRGLTMLHLQPEASDPAEWLSGTPGLYWSAAVGRPKPGAEVLMERPAGAGGESAVPVIVLGRYGAGRTLLHGSDDTWRWRKEVGDRYHDGYWLGVLRYLARNKLLGQDRRMLLQADRQLYAAGEAVQLRLTALDASLAAEWPQRMPVVATDGAGQVVGRLELTATEPNASERSATWTPPGLGQFTFAIDSPGFGGGSVREAVQVAADAEESRDTSPDPILLHRLTAGTGGVSLRLEDLSQLPELLRDRPARTVEEAVVPLWDTSWALLVLVGLLAAEWTARKRSGLV